MRKFLRGLILGSFLGSFLTFSLAMRSGIFKNAVFDWTEQKIRKLVYGDIRSPSFPYGYRSPIGRQPRFNYRVPVVNRPRPRYSMVPNKCTLPTQQEADVVLERLQEIIGNFGYATQSDFRQLVGLPVVHNDNVMGWTNLDGIEPIQTDTGFCIELPEPKDINALNPS
jgi:hypothetical protein